ncbi:class I adenylate-forming enzyme family protein [Mycobacterium decipiens]|nr:class I adenylate-forming enzyme family protein [Mycobacterium decipiens]
MCTVAEAHRVLTAPGQPYETEQRIVAGRRTSVWKNAPATLLDLFGSARAHGDRLFVVYENQRVSYRSFARAAVALAHALSDDGVQPGDRVAVIMSNRPQWPVAFYGALLAGAIVVPLNAWWTARELEYVLSDCDARVVIADRERLARLGPSLSVCAAMRRVYVTQDTAELDHCDRAVVPLEAVIGDSSAWDGLPDQPPPDLKVDPDADATIFYTSGTTGKPKGAIGTHRNAATVAFASGFGPARAALRRGEPIPVPDHHAPAKCTLLSVPLFHVTGSLTILHSVMLAGDHIVLMSRWDPREALNLIERERCTTIGGVPTIAWQILHHPDRQQFDLSSIETVNYGGAPAATALAQRITDTWSQATPAQGWGMTETSGTFTAHGGEDYLTHPDSCGLALPTGDMIIVDKRGNQLRPNQVGELWVRGANVVRGYWNNPTATAEAFTDGWLRTGDLARINPDGYLTIVDRKKDMLIRGGENIYTTEVESALYEHPAVVDAAVIGLAHPTLGEQPAAVVHLVAGADVSDAELHDHLAQRLARYKLPVSFARHPEMLPRNPNGKIVKQALRHHFQ